MSEECKFSAANYGDHVEEDEVTSELVQGIRVKSHYDLVQSFDAHRWAKITEAAQALVQTRKQAVKTIKQENAGTAVRLQSPPIYVPSDSD